MILLVIPYILVLIALASIFNGYVLSILWGWFMVPTFGLPVLSVAPAIGVALIVSYLTYQSIDTQEKDEDSTTKLVKSSIMVFIRAALALFIGWIIQMFM